MAPNQNQVAVGLGSNLHNRFDFLVQAAEALCALPFLREPQFSPIYETAAVDCPDPRPFLNAAACFLCHEHPEVLLTALQGIEQQLDRRRPYRNAPRTIDLDLLLFGNRKIETPRLQVPHPRFHLRLFVTTPLAQIAPDRRHPDLNCTLAELDQHLRQTQQDANPSPTLHTRQWSRTFH
ncbi:2-amino-4-hydroxy-6-hydroxymethyldihydropteridine diphosphokinase [Acanthopleuribacter pedis]|uniref:2-amino-4-hydroxy-6-hydroxymethyldihydropteridine pyrophosphokinase n=1 Tax=Acanthopleuribacter pedis TaxID=442870 RepID=A0A8J7Q990_9BACT|nr:2-amino-4-hydroxy-6-hydroxymethyldihydropteridine diphosphokinase [Acanthopleuribacter pedis]MBO1320956.1 2-amino-4-hydroxy-6-hydroxymethyldihydropteridine diphosphokinase [Acanthopleuribacter pedis]